MSVSTESSLSEEHLRGVMTLYEGQLIRFATNITRDSDLARDVAQDTFMKWIRAMLPDSTVSIPPEGDRLKAWLFTVCRNRALDIVRKEKNMNHLDEESKRIASPASSPSVVAETSEEVGRVTSAMASLPEKQQEVLRLKYQNGFTYRQIADITGNSISHVGVLIHNGLQKLRNHFKTIKLIGD